MVTIKMGGLGGSVQPTLCGPSLRRLLSASDAVASLKYSCRNAYMYQSNNLQFRAQKLFNHGKQVTYLPKSCDR